MNLILIDKSEIDQNASVRLEGRRAVHIIDILKADPGKELRIGQINGPLGTGTVKEIESKSVVMEVVLDEPPPARPAVDIFLALPRPLVMKRLWSVLPSVGVGRIILTNASKVERFYFDTHWLDETHYMPLIMQGLEQAGDTFVPGVSITRQFKVFLEDELDTVFPEGRRLLAHPGDDGVPMGDIEQAEGQRILLAIGPEGGWTEHELGVLDDHGFEHVTMGWRTLRTEAACVSAIALLSR